MDDIQGLGTPMDELRVGLYMNYMMMDYGYNDGLYDMYGL